MGEKDWSVLRDSHNNYAPGIRSIYRNDPKFSDTQNICCNHSKVWTMWLYHRLMSPNDAVGMTNSVDPDQTATGLSVRKLRIITVGGIQFLSFL